MIDIENDSNSFVYKTKDHGMFSAIASLGLLNIWNLELSLTHLELIYILKMVI